MPISRANRFLLRVVTVFLVLVLAGIVLYLVQVFFQPFDDQLKFINDWIITTNQAISRELITGISGGLVVLVLLIFITPLFMRGVNNKQYMVATWRGIISSFVFLVTQALYDYAEQISRFYLIVAIVAVVILSLILIEYLSLMMKQEEQVAFRTDIVSALVSGLIFGIVMKVIFLMVDMIKHANIGLN